MPKKKVAKKVKIMPILSRKTAAEKKQEALEKKAQRDRMLFKSKITHKKRFYTTAEQFNQLKHPKLYVHSAHDT